MVDQLEIRSYFNHLHSAEKEAYGKPHPGVFITAAKSLNTVPQHCIVFEDSLNGIIAAKAARMQAVLVPDNINSNDARFAIADAKIDTLSHYTDKIEQQLIKNMR